MVLRASLKNRILVGLVWLSVSAGCLVGASSSFRTADVVLGSLLLACGCLSVHIGVRAVAGYIRVDDSGVTAVYVFRSRHYEWSCIRGWYTTVFADWRLIGVELVDGKRKRLPMFQQPGGNSDTDRVLVALEEQLIKHARSA
jgi:hypothetical protein